MSPFNRPSTKYESLNDVHPDFRKRYPTGVRAHPDKAGMVPGDIALEFGGRTTNNIEELVEEIQKREAEEAVGMLIIRDTRRWIVEGVLKRTS